MEYQAHDKGYKRILSQKKQFLILLKDYIKAPWAENLTEEDAELIDKEFIPKDFMNKEADIIYKLNVNGKEVFVYCLLELQSTIDFTMPFRLLIYMVELLKRIFLDTPEEIRTRKDYRIPTVIPMVLYNGGDKWTAVQSFKEYQLNGEIGDFAIDFKYHLIDVSRFDSKNLQEVGGLLASVFLLDGIKGGKQLSEALGKAADILVDSTEDEVIAFTDWVKDVFIRRVPESIKDTVAEVVEALKKGDEGMTYALERVWAKEEQEAIQKGRQEGRQEGQILVYSKEFGYSAGEIAKKLDLSFEYVAEVLQEVGA